MYSAAVCASDMLLSSLGPGSEKRVLESGVPKSGVPVGGSFREPAFSRRRLQPGPHEYPCEERALVL